MLDGGGPLMLRHFKLNTRFLVVGGRGPDYHRRIVTLPPGLDLSIW